MKISKASWHYQLNDSIYSDMGSKPFTTCSYIRTTAISIMAWLGMIFTLLAVAGILLNAVVTPVLLLFGVNVIADYVAAAFFVWFIGILWLIVLGVSKGLEWIEQKSDDKANSLLQQAKEDRKNGICTLVEFE